MVDKKLDQGLKHELGEGRFEAAKLPESSIDHA